MNVLEFTCPCGIKHEAWTVGINKRGKYAEQVFDIMPKKCLHAYQALGNQLRRKGGKITIIGKGKMLDIVKHYW